MTTTWITDDITTDLGRAVNYTLHWGLDGLVLRAVDGNARVPDVNESRLRHRLEESELELVAIDPGLFEGSVEARTTWMNDLARLRESIEFCKRFGCKRILTGALPGGSIEAAADALRRAAVLAQQSGITLLLRNEGEGREHFAEMEGLLDAIAHPGVAVCLDLAVAAAAGEDVAPLLAELDERVGMVVVRDVAAESQSGEPEAAKLIRNLAVGGYDGPLCLDLAGRRPPEALREATALIYLVRDAVRGR